MIEVLFEEDEEHSKVLNAGKSEPDWEVKDKKDEHYFLKLLGFHMYAAYKAIIENPKVKIYGIPQRIFDWLKIMGQQFVLGIAEFSYSIGAGAFPLFEEIGLKKYIATSSTIPLPIHLHFLGQEHYYSMPELMHPQVYFKYYEQNQVEYLKLARKRALEKNLLGNHKLIKVEEMPKMWDLLRKSKYYLINVHPLGQFPFPNIPKRIVNIGGIEVEIEGILNEIEEEKRLEGKEKTNPIDYVFEWIKEALYAGVPLILIPFPFEEKFNAKVAEYMGVGINFDHTKFLSEFTFAVAKLMREDQELNPNMFVENANKIKKAIHKFPKGQIKMFLETVEKAIEEKDEEEPFPEMRTKFEEKSFENKPFSVVLEEFVNSKQK
uniref:glucuronosyltransferase n=1 Tax=Meloidogyne javanica TaxID=6303 RepID=A0A915MRE3_MELJA